MPFTTTTARNCFALALLSTAQVAAWLPSPLRTIPSAAGCWKWSSGSSSSRRSGSRPTGTSTRSSSTTTTSPSSSTSLRATAQLVFVGDYNASSRVLPQGTTLEDVSDFLSDPATHEVFLTAGGTRRMGRLEVTPEFKEYWENACRDFDSQGTPTDDDELLTVDTEIKFPGMKLITTTVSGIHEVHANENAASVGRYGSKKDSSSALVQGLEVLLVAEKQEAKGVPAVVWLHNKLMGNEEREKGRFYPSQQTKARSYIAPSIVDDGLALSFSVNLKVTVEFPAVLLKLLPVSREKAEKQGTNAIVKTVSKDIDLALAAAYDKFVTEYSPSSASLEAR